MSRHLSRAAACLPSQNLSHIGLAGLCRWHALGTPCCLSCFLYHTHLFIHSLTPVLPEPLLRAGY